MTARYRNAHEAIDSAAIRLNGNTRDYDALVEAVADRSFVLLGEATHGTHEFYRMRAEITQRLIVEKNFDAVVVEADWPDAYRLNRYVRNESTDATIEAAFSDFERFPAWMWKNRDVLDFILWLHRHNVDCDSDHRVGFYGMDLYSLYRSIDRVIAYLESVDPDQAVAARRLYAALDHVRDPQDYGLQAASGLRQGCREGAVKLLTDLIGKGPSYLSHDGRLARDEQFFAERNAHVVLNAEQYYRAMFTGRVNTWNLRDTHMTNTLLALQQHLRESGRSGRLVVWAHNSHLGDASATESSARGEWNVGQLVRRHVGAHDALLVGFTTYTGYVTAARDWDGPAERRWVRPAHHDSYERLFYETHLDRFFLRFCKKEDEAIKNAVDDELRLERAIGVLYRPETELASHYFHAALAKQFDAVFHIDETSAVEPLEPSDLWRVHEPVEIHA